MRGGLLEAFVVLRDGEAGDGALVVELQQLVRTRYGAHAYPRRVHFEADLPEKPCDKIQRNVLRDRRRNSTVGAPATTSV
jgi:acetyl-CoA synthetase